MSSIGDQKNGMGAELRTIGIVRARCKIGMTPLRLPRKDDGRGRVNRRTMGVGRVSELRKVTSQKPGGNFRQPSIRGQGSNNLAVPRP